MIRRPLAKVVYILTIFKNRSILDLKCLTFSKKYDILRGPLGHPNDDKGRDTMNAMVRTPSLSATKNPAGELVDMVASAGIKVRPAYAQVDNIEVFALDIGPETAEDVTILVTEGLLVPPMMTNQQGFMAANRRLLVVACSKSRNVPDLAEAQAKAIYQLVKDLGLKNATQVAGLRYGCMAATAFAVMYGDELGTNINYFDDLVGLYMFNVPPMKPTQSKAAKAVKTVVNRIGRHHQLPGPTTTAIARRESGQMTIGRMMTSRIADVIGLGDIDPFSDMLPKDKELVASEPWNQIFQLAAEFAEVHNLGCIEQDWTHWVKKTTAPTHFIDAYRSLLHAIFDSDPNDTFWCFLHSREPRIGYGTGVASPSIFKGVYQNFDWWLHWRKP